MTSPAPLAPAEVSSWRRLRRGQGRTGPRASGCSCVTAALRGRSAAGRGQLGADLRERLGQRVDRLRQLALVLVAQTLVGDIVAGGPLLIGDQRRVHPVEALLDEAGQV